MLSLFAEDLGKHVEGSPCYINQMCFYVRRSGTKESNETLKEISLKIYGPFPKPGEINESEIVANWLAEYGVVGWDDVTNDEDGELIPYDKAFCRQLFLSEKYWLSLNQVLFAHAANFENYLHDQAYEDGENLKKD